MTHTILSSCIASISDLKKNPMATIASSFGEPIAILNRNEPVFYCVPTKHFEHLMEVIEDLNLSEIIKKRLNEKEVEINLNDL